MGRDASRARAVNSELNHIEELADNLEDILVGRKPTVKNSTKPVTTKKPKMSWEQEFDLFIDNHGYSEFQSRQWLMYWQKKAKECGIDYKVGHYAKENAILKKLMNEFSTSQIKTMIDFLWESNQDIYDKRLMGVWILSGMWTNTVFQSSVMWEEGTYKSSKEQKEQKNKVATRNREWVSKETKTKTVDKPVKKGNSIRI